MSQEQVKNVLVGNLVSQTAGRGPERTLAYDLGEGQKLVCNFFHERFYACVRIRSPSTASRRQRRRSYSGLQGNTDQARPWRATRTQRKGRPLTVLKWNDGISEIEFRAPDLELWKSAPTAPAAFMPGAVAYAAARRDEKDFPSSTIMVLYTGIAIEAESRRLSEEDKVRREKSAASRLLNNL